MRIMKRFFICATILILFTSPVLAEGRRGPSPRELADVSFKVTIPLEEVYQDVLKALEKMGGSGSAIDGNIVTQANPDAMFRGLYNSSYQSVVDLPLTRYVLGYATVDVEKLTDVFYKYMEIVNPPKTVLRQGERTQMFDLRWQQISKAMEQTAPLINDFLKEAQKGFFTIMTLIPLGLLFVMFSAQMVSIGWTNLIKPHMSARISVLSILPRFLVFFMFMLVYRQVVAWCITFSNYASIAIVPLDMQESIFSGIIQSLNTTLAGGSGIMSWVASTMRSLGYIAIKILFVARDVFLAISVLMGGVCIALGFFSTYDQSDPIHEYLTGWMQGFVKLLFWGPFAAIAVVGMGIVTLISTTGAMSATAVAIASLAFLYAAGNIPNLAERMSGLALQGLILAAAPMMSQVMGTTGRATGAVGGMLIGARLRNAVSSMVSKIGVGSPSSPGRSSERIVVDTGAKDYANNDEGRPPSADESRITQDAKRVAPVPIPRTPLNTEGQKKDDVPTPEGGGVGNVRKPGERENTGIIPDGIVADDINESQDSEINSVRDIESSSPDKPPLTLMEQRRRKEDILRVLKKMPGYVPAMATWSLGDLEKEFAAVKKSDGQGPRPGA